MIIVNKEQINLYSSYIKAIASLSRLFSDKEVPFLHYRVVENIFCNSFQADNLSRSDIAYDARLNSIGIGLKTFTVSSKTTREKIAEFNAHSRELNKYNTDNLILKLGELRNNRIDFANRTYGIKKGIYHCLARQKGRIKIFELGYYPIDIKNIRVIKEKKSSIYFEDGKYEYSFNFSKSTLYKKFYIPEKTLTLDINIIKEPYEIIFNLLKDYSFHNEQDYPYVILPLYSTMNKNNRKIVAEKSGLNQWNAGGRKRHPGEVYIPIPQKIHQHYPDFFPSREQVFEIILPTNDKLQAKICQEGEKALMSNPNKALSEWLLRKVLKLKLKEVLTYEHLKNLGVDSVKVTKLQDKIFKIDFSQIDSYENF